MLFNHNLKYNNEFHFHLMNLQTYKKNKEYLNIQFLHNLKENLFSSFIKFFTDSPEELYNITVASSETIFITTNLSFIQAKEVEFIEFVFVYSIFTFGLPSSFKI